ncbi:autotransporter domain-containing protein [Bilophila wadsworthia]|uniref:autotransporter domain-containing protein n=1 Tax=Bilophila wadsworthia TaxID=35833 RepID=UPI0026E0AFD1|nr:autotransporter domain-containing protein [Bilophila wadsworthia]
MMNVFGSLAVAGMLVAGNAGFAGAEELSGDISPISLSGDTRNIIGVGDISLRSTEPALRYLINVSGQGQLDISMSNGSPMAVGNADGIYLKDYSEYDQYASAFHVAGSGSSGSFVGTGTFSMVGGGKLLGVCAFLSESKGTLTLSGDITGEAEAVMNGSNGYASFAAAAAGGNLVFGGDRTTLRAKASTGNNANGAFVKYGGMIDFASKSVLIESKNTDSSSVGINCADGTVKTSADTDLDIVVEGNKATTGIQLTASSSDVQLAGNLDLTATQTGQDSFASVLGISNDSGKMVVSGPTSLRLATNAPFDAKGITASGKADMSFLGDVEIAVTGSASGSALYTTYRYDYSTQAGICPVISLGTDGKAVTLNSSGYGINNQGGSVSLTGQRINITGSTGVFVEGGGNENVFADVRFDGPTTINADKAIVTSIKAGEQVGASVTFAYNPTPINVPVTKESADSKVRGSVTGSSGTINKENAGSLAFYGDISNFSGVFNQKGGTTFLSEGAAGYFGKAQLAVTGGALVAPTLSFQKTGKLTLAGGTLETGTGQIFTSALNVDGDMKDPGAVKLSDSNWKFDSGVIAFDDARYNIVYAQTAAGLLGAGNVAADNVSGSGSAKEITFTGTLVELPPGDPDSFETLQKAVLDTGIDSIKLGSDIVLSKRLQGTTPVARSLAIDGNGHTISGAYPGLWFKGMDSGTVSIQNIAFDGLKTSSGDRYEGPVSFGPAIFFDMGYFADNWKSTAKLIIGDGVQFRNTESVGDGAGGAVRTAHGIVEIGNNVGFINCTGGSGGGLYSESFTTIGDNVVFEGNKGRRGGALNVVDDYEDYLTDPDYASGARRVKYVHIGKNALFKNNSVELLGSGGNGGAIEVQSGELSIDDGATFTGNSSKSTGGAIAVCDWSPQLPAKAVLGSATFTQNSAGSYGGAIINEGDVRFNGPVSFVENTAGKIGGAVCNLNTLNMAAESTFSKNTAGVGGGLYNEGIASLGKASFIENAAADGGGAVFNVHQLTFADGAVFSGNSATDGGAVYNDFSEDKDGNAVSAGSLAFNGGARFIGNTASGLGGAIYNTRSITLNPGAGQEIVFSGNTDSTGSNAIFMGDGSSLDITGDGKVVFDDALSSQSATPTLKKTGSGELLLNASMDGFLGTAAFEDGRTEIAQKWLIKNTVTITGGRLKMPAFSFVAQGEGNNVAGGKLILAGGILETGTGQIFINGLNAEGDNKDPGAVKLSGDNWSFDSGLIAFNDALYNLTYAQAAADSLGANNVEAGEGAGSTSAKEITFIGTGYVDPVPDPVPPVDPVPDPVPPVEPDPTPPAPEPKPDEDRTGKVSVDELNNNHANNIVLGNVTITTGTSSDSGKDFVVGASGKNIDLGSSGRNISVVGGHYLTLVGGSSDTPLVTAGGNPVNVHVGGTGEGASGVLNLGTPVMDSGGTLSGNIEIAAASTVNVRAGTHVITGEANETTGTADVAGMNNNGGTINIAEGAHLQSTIRQADGQTNVSGKLTSASVELSGGALNVSGAVDSSSVTASKGDIKVAGTLAADVLTTSSDVQLNIGDQGSAGRVVARQAQLQGGRVFLDPAWKGNDALADASHGVFTFVNNEIDGLLTAGQNSLLVLGDTDTGWALDAFGRSSLQWGQNGVTAALAIRKPQTLNGTLGAVMVDGTKTSAPVLIPNTATFADGSLLLVDGSGLNGAAALTSQGGTLNVDAGAKLLIDNITQGEYAITSGFSVSNVQGWNGDNLSTPDNLIGLVLGKDADGSMKVQATARRSSDVFRGLSLVNTMDAIWGKGLNDTESGNMGIRFLSRAVNENHLPKADTVHTVDGAAQIAVAGGVQGMAVAAADAPVRAIQDHASLLHMTTTREGAIRKDGLNLWINALYGAEHARNLGAGSLDGGYNADFGGIVFGGDYAFGDFRVGMALNAGSGTARSRGDFNATKNDFDFWGMNLYGSWSRDQFNIVGDLGYSANKNEVKQDLPTTMQLGQLRADVDTGVLTAGLRGEYRFETDWADVTPHVGVRYYNLRTDGFTSRIDDHDVFRVGRDTQEIWTFPIGVSFSRDFETSSGWKVKPRADLSVVPAAGDLKAKTKVRVPGVAASDTIKARMMDSVSFDGTLGLEVQKDNISFGLDYGIRASEHKAGHGVNVSFTYKF